MSHEALSLWTATSSDPELIAGVRAGDRDAYGLLYERHAPAARAVALRYTNTPADADDVVAESFTRILRILHQGDGPDLAFRAYLFTVVRRTGLDVIARNKAARPEGDFTPFESRLGTGAGSDEPTMDGLEHSMVSEAFESLPERWRAVLWYTEVEGKLPKEVAPLLGLSANGVAALAYRAREALRQGYLQQHLASVRDESCAQANAHLGAYVRGGLSRREHAKVEAHVRECDNCTVLAAELGDVNRGLRGIIAPLVLGLAGMGALEGGLPIGGVFGLGGAGGLGGVAGAGAGGQGSGASAGAASGAGGAGVSAGGAGGVGAGVAAIALPAAAALGVVALAVTGASVLGLFGQQGNAPAGNAGDRTGVSPKDAGVSGGDTVTKDSADAGATTSPDTVTVNPAPGDSAAGDPGSGDSAAGDPAPGDTAEPDVAPTTPAPSPDPGSGSTTTPTPAQTTPPTTPPSPAPSATAHPSPTPTTPAPTTPATPPTTTPAPTPPPGPGTGGGTGSGTGSGGDTDSPTPPGSGVTLLSLAAAPLGALAIDRLSPTVTLPLTNKGDGTALDVTAGIVLPAGLTFAAPPAGASPFTRVDAAAIGASLTFADTREITAGSWTCTIAASAAQASCALDRLAAGAAAPLTLALAPLDGAFELDQDAVTGFTASSGTDAVASTIPTGIIDSPTSLAVSGTITGRVAAATVGAPLLGCATSDCTTALDDRGHSWGSGGGWHAGGGQASAPELAPLNTAGGATVSNSTTLTPGLLPEGATVESATLAWSALRTPGATWTGPLATAWLRVPGGAFTSITADAVDLTAVGDATAYVATADVTAAVAAAGGGTYAVADVALPAGPGGTGITLDSYAGFTLTVVYSLPSLPRATVVTLAGHQWLTGGATGSVLLSSPERGSLDIAWAAFQPAGSPGTTALRVGDRELQSWAWSGSHRVGDGQRGSTTAFGCGDADSLGTQASAVKTAQISEGLHRVAVAPVSGDIVLTGLTVTVTPQQ